MCENIIMSCVNSLKSTHPIQVFHEEIYALRAARNFIIPKKARIFIMTDLVFIFPLGHYGSIIRPNFLDKFIDIIPGNVRHGQHLSLLITNNSDKEYVCNKDQFFSYLIVNKCTESPLLVKVSCIENESNLRFNSKTS